ncbi:hypothetical protein SEA_ROMAN_11 [Microbacterium phage Roman]|nr:hypothetical protein SEA_ROMAN_11 [Microbacterium phage Roman]
MSDFYDEDAVREVLGRKDDDYDPYYDDPQVETEGDRW